MNPDIRTPLVVIFSLGVVIYFSPLTAFDVRVLLRTFNSTNMIFIDFEVFDKVLILER